ncbi:hypothetical protein R5R35_006506 [Gryllus longicercus]|uniref:Vacuolar ATPase assembly protein VMA22 n=1 Tax=Gryllus longicercus TaxID=2509291 RepID=A0AAN9Z5D4_9ORTH
MDNKLSEICKQLDQLALDILKLCEEQVKCRVKLEEAMKPGFVHIAKSRYIMGNRTVCSLQLPTEDSAEFDALTTVVPQESITDSEHRGFKLVETPKGQDTSGKSVLRRRKEKPESDASTEAKEENVKTYVDPIKWFGVLVPQNLKMAQNCFQSVLPLVVECANVQGELQRVQMKYQKLLKEKELLS